MIKNDELEMMKIALSKYPNSGELIKYVGDSKRKHYILCKWDKKGYWDYGVSLRSGWLTDFGFRSLSIICSTIPGDT